MQKVLRLIAVSFVLVAAIAVASAPAANNSVVYAEGTSPVPLCYPGTDCGPVAAKKAPAAKEGTSPVPLCYPGTDCGPVQ